MAEVDANHVALAVLDLSLSNIPALLNSVLIEAITYPEQLASIYLLLREAPCESFSLASVKKLFYEVIFDRIQLHDRVYQWLFFYAYVYGVLSPPGRCREIYFLLQAAAELEDSKQTEELLTKLKIKTVKTDNYGMCLARLLRRAVIAGSLDVAHMLIKQGATFTTSNTDESLVAIAFAHEDLKLLRVLLGNGAPLPPPCSYKIYQQEHSLCENEFSHEIRVRQLRPIEKKLYRLLIKYGGVLLESGSKADSINAITLRVLFDNKLLGEVFIGRNLPRYISCILHNILEAKHQQVTTLIANISHYLPESYCSTEELNSCMVKILHECLDVVSNIPQACPNIIYALANIFEFIKAKHAGYLVSNIYLARSLEKITVLLQNLRIEHKRMLFNRNFSKY